MKLFHLRSSILLILLMATGAFARSTSSSTPVHTWPKNNACFFYVEAEKDPATGSVVKKGRYSCMKVTDEADSQDFSDVNAVVSQLLRQPGTVSTPEFVMYYTGAVALGGPAEYYTDEEMSQSDLSGDVMSEKMSQMMSKPWITLIQPLHRETEEDGCLNVGRTPKGTPYGCGDVWQGGIQDSELACWKGQTYVRCQLDCYKKYRNKTVKYTKGACQ